MADNLVLQAKFFDMIFQAVIDSLFGFGRESRLSIFGKVVAHYHIIKAQGKGTLYVHGLIWTADGTGYSQCSLLYSHRALIFSFVSINRLCVH